MDLVACDVTLMFGVSCYFPLRGLYEDYRPAFLNNSPRLNVLHKTTHACMSQIGLKRQFVLLHKNIVMNNKMGHNGATVVQRANASLENNIMQILRCKHHYLG